MKNQDKKLLVFHPGALGDFIVTFSCLNQLRSVYTGIDVVCQGQNGQLSRSFNLTDQCFSIESAAFASLFSGSLDPRLKAMLKPYNTIILFSFANRIKQTLDSIRIDKIALIHPRPLPDVRQHICEYIHEQLCRHGLLDTPSPISGLKHFMNRIHGHSSTHKSKNVIAIHPGSGSIRKNWPVHNYIKVHLRLEQLGYATEFIIGPADRLILKELEKAGITRIFQTNQLTELAKHLKETDVYIGNDSGVSHLAGFLNLPSIIVFGPSDPIRWRPAGNHVHILRPELSCTPCFEVQNKNCDNPQCLSLIRPQDVLNALFDIIN